MLNILGVNYAIHFKSNRFVIDIPNRLILYISSYGVHNFAFSMFLYDKKLIYYGDHIRSKKQLLFDIQFYISKYLNNVVQ